MPSVIKSSRIVMRDFPIEEAEIAELDGLSAEEERDSARKASDEILAAARKDASGLLREADEEALRITRKAEHEAAELKKTAEWSAYQQGIDKAEREIRDLYARAQADIDSTTQKAKDECDALMDNLEPRIFKLALEVAEKILGYELEHNENAFLSMVREALGSVKNENRVTLRVNPGEFVKFSKSREINLHTSNGSLKAEVTSDPTVVFGGCLIETESGAIDAGADAQLRQISRNLGLEDE